MTSRIESSPITMSALTKAGGLGLRVNKMCLLKTPYAIFGLEEPAQDSQKGAELTNSN